MVSQFWLWAGEVSVSVHSIAHPAGQCTSTTQLYEAKERPNSASYVQTSRALVTLTAAYTKARISGMANLKL